MRRYHYLALLAAITVYWHPALFAQDLAPRAYVITPLHSNAVTVTWSYYNGGLDFNGTVPISNARGSYNVPIFSYYHSLNFFGRSANIVASLPYGVGTFSGEVNSQKSSIYRSGLLDLGFRLSVNLLGGPALQPQQFGKWHQKVLLGASLKVVAPTGQYDPARLVNWGINRWAFKPEFGYSQRWGNWILDGYAGVWFYTTNSAYYNIPVPQPQTQSPIGSLEGHLSYDIPKFKAFRRARFWRRWMAISGGAALPRSTTSEISRPSRPVRASEGPLRFPWPRASRSRSPTATAPISALEEITTMSRSHASIRGSGIPSRPRVHSPARPRLFKALKRHDLH